MSPLLPDDELLSAGASPSVTVAIPTLNEERNIRGLLEIFQRSAYPNIVEIMVADGGSSDATRDIVREAAERDHRVRLIENPDRIQAAGLNQILGACSGEIYLRADAHSEYAADYVEQCVETLTGKRALGVGGAQRFVARAAFQSGVALASRNLLGNGGAPHHDPGYDGWIHAAWLGCFWTKALRAIGGYRQTATNEDAELQIRMRKWSLDAFPERGADLFYSSPRIRVWYYPRDRWPRLVRQYFHYGRGRYATVRDYPGASPLRSHIPFVAVPTAGLAFVVDQLLLGGALRTGLLGLVGALGVLGSGVYTSWRLRERFPSEIWRGAKGSEPGVVIRGLLCGCVILTQPVAHSVGFGYAWIQDLFGRRQLLAAAPPTGDA